MGVSIGGIDLANGIISCELRIGIHEKIINHLLSRMPAGTISQSDVDRFRRQTIQELQQKYPDAGISGV